MHPLWMLHYLLAEYLFMDTTWSLADLMDELERFEQEARGAGLK